MSQPAQRLISSSALSHGLKSALAGADYKTFADLDGLVAEDLSLELSITIIQAENIIALRDDSNHLSTQPHPTPTPAAPLTSTPASVLLAASCSTLFSTLSDPVDHLISNFTEVQNARSSRKGKQRMGGITPGTSVEISGPPGSGKTAMGIAIALSCRLGRYIDPDSDADPGEVLLIDTEGSITPERLTQSAQSLTRNTEESPESAIQGIHLMRISTQVQMIAMLQILDDWLEERPKVKLVVIDTLSFQFRQPSMDMKTRSRMMELVKQQVGKATSQRNCAVVLTNQLATKLLTADNKPANFDTGDRAVLMPQLGDTWTTAKTIRVVLFRGTDELRYAHASSSGIRQDVGWSRYDIDHDGLPCDPVETLAK